MSAVLEPNGAATSGQQPAGIVQQYQLAGTASAVDTSTGITPYDSGTIVVQTKPGQAPEKLVSGVVQRAAQIVSDGTVAGGNALQVTAGEGLVPQPPAGQHQADGLSNFPGRE